MFTLLIDIAAYQTASYLENQYSSKYSFGGGMNRNGVADKEVNSANNQLIKTYLSWAPELDQASLVVEAGYSYQEFNGSGFSTGNKRNTSSFFSSASSYSSNSRTQVRQQEVELNRRSIKMSSTCK